MHHYPTARSFKFVVRRGAAPAHVFVPTQRRRGGGEVGGPQQRRRRRRAPARQRERRDLKRGGSKYERRKEAQAARREHVAANTLPEDELADTFRDDVTGL